MSKFNKSGKEKNKKSNKKNIEIDKRVKNAVSLLERYVKSRDLRDVRKWLLIIIMMLATGLIVGLATGAFGGGEEEETTPRAATPSEIPITQENTTSDTTEAETEEVFVPEADKLNLAYIFPEGADESDPLNSYAGEVYKELMKEDNAYLADIYDIAGDSPRTVAGRLGVSGSRVMGKYNPKDSTHDKDNPATWYISSFKNVNVSFYNSDGKRVNEYSNVKDIMSMASVYCYHHDYLDVETFKEYCRELYSKSRSYKMSIGSVYYDDGCINRSAKEEADDAKKADKILEILREHLSKVDSEVESPESDSGSLNSASGETASANSSSVESSSGDYASGESTSAKAVSGEIISGASNQAVESSLAGNETVASSQAVETAALADSTSEKVDDSVATDTSSSQTAVSADANPAETSAGFIMQPGYGSNGSVLMEDFAVESAPQEVIQSGGGSVAAAGRDTSVAITPLDTLPLPGNPNAATETVNEVSEGEVLLEDAAAGDTSESVAENVNTAESTNASTEESTQESDVTSEGNIERILKEKYSVDDLRNMDDTMLLSLIKEALEAEAEKKDSNSETDVKSKNYCPGHVDLYVSVTIKGFEDEKGLKTIEFEPKSTDSEAEDVKAHEEKTETSGKSDSAENTKKKATDETSGAESKKAGVKSGKSGSEGLKKSGENQPETVEKPNEGMIDDMDETLASDGTSGWQGWTEESISEVERLVSRDWFKTYGFSISTIDPKNPLTEEEISRYLDGLPDDISGDRKKVIKFALESVGKVPYYWGGKAAGKNYEKNNFGSVVQSDYRGRVLRGLDCSGWVQWVYWSAINNNLNGSCSSGSLVGEGESIRRADLEPGDIVIRVGADSHVVMFLGWGANGKMIVIHENSSANNVSVNEVTASYPYYRKLIN
ncbi:C40 family peptidase [Oribacterium sp. WCC10]|uniref:C40 family peptidase n=1 Tax=Oribacterium sp. WCC10 TaxID=1855343 RepID=UPI0008ED5075|nr:NlpC/P60 family protein [Oribacterium sp. WCC10]SFG08451.1 Cell wall-associated hydrolase, NlpC family [Oribacterium sp. WCC10]